MGFRFRPYDLMPIRINGRIVPARYKDNGWGTIIHMKKHSDESWKVKVILTGETEEKEGIFYSHGELEVT